MPHDPRVVGVLRLAAEGLGAIAARLGCDRDAVRGHLADAIRTLGARSVPDAVEVAIGRGLIQPTAGRSRPA